MENANNNDIDTEQQYQGALRMMVKLKLTNSHSKRKYMDHSVPK